MRHLKIKTMLWCSVAALPAIAQAQQEQATGAASSASSSSEDVNVAGEIVVTAQRRTERLQDVPIAVTALNQDAAESLGISTMIDVAKVTPGAYFGNTSGGFFQPYIRGIGQLFVNPGLEGPVAVYVDGAYIPRTLQITELLDSVDIASIQVLRGPQGTLYGRNATAGVVILNTADPEIGTYSGKIRAEYGRFNHQIAEGVINTPLAEDLALRVTARYRREGGFVKNAFVDDKTGDGRSYGLRAKLRWQPEGADITLGGEYQNTKYDLAIGILADGGATCYACRLFGVDYSPGGYYTQGSNPQPAVQNKAYGANLKAIFDLSPHLQLTSTTTWRKQRADGYNDQDFTPLDLFNFTIPAVGNTTFTQDFVFATSLDGPVNFLGGVSYLQDRGLYDISFTGQFFAGPVATTGEFPRFINVGKTKSYAAFAEVYYNITPELKVTAGGRYTSDKRKLNGTLRDSFAQLIGFPGGGFDYKLKTSIHAFTPRFVLAWDNGPTNVYYSFTRGFKAGGFGGPVVVPFNGDGTPLSPVASEKVTSHEVGLKQRFGAVTINLAAFYLKNKNLQTQTIDVASGGVVTQNAGALENYGLEAELQLRPIQGLQLSAQGSVQHARYKPYRVAAVICFDPAGQSNPGAPGATLYACTEDLTGRRPPNAPTLSLSGTASYTFDVGDWSANLAGLVTYRSSIDFTPGAGGPLRFDRDKQRTITNISGYVSPSGGKLRLGFYVNNLFDVKYPGFRTTTQPYALEYEPARPITYGLRVNAEF